MSKLFYIFAFIILGFLILISLNYNDVFAYIAKVVTGLTKTSVITPNSTGLVAFWNFDDCDTCSTAKDFSGNSNTGTFQGNAAHTASGKINRGITLDGTGDYALVTDSASLDLTSALTISSWVSLNSLTCTGVDNVGGLVAKHDSTTTKDGYALIYACSNDKMYFQGGDGTTWASLSVASSQTYAQTNRWYHVVGTFDGTTGYLYVDSENVGSDTSAALSDNAQNLWIGGDVNSNSNFLNAKLDEVRIYNRVLSAAEVKTLYESGR
ncbi:MAG: LamG domain-containing protein [Patescibacteria group bacterium]